MFCGRGIGSGILRPGCWNQADLTVSLGLGSNLELEGFWNGHYCDLEVEFGKDKVLGNR